MLDSEEHRKKLIAPFPKLANDSDFKITDREDPNYNCIALAAIVTDKNWWPIPEEERPIKQLDGVIWDWPYNAANNTKLDTFVYVFSKKRYEKCDNGEYEEGFRKICIYGHDKENVTHASRQLTNKPDIGKWTSKIGGSFRIVHGSPSSVESKAYGKVLQFMKCKWP